MSPRSTVHHHPLPARGLAVAALTAAAVGLAACGSGDGTSAATAKDPYGAPAASSTAKPAAAAPASTGAALRAGHGALGTFLVDAQGRPVYLFEADRSGTSTCAGECAAAWPPVTATGTPKVGAGLDGALVATTRRADGSRQLTYAGHPLYRFAPDGQGSTPTGQGVDAFGAPWYVLRPSGEKLDDD